MSRLQGRIDGRMDGVGFRGQARDAVGFRLAAQKIDEMQAAVAPPLLERQKLGRGRERAILVLGRDYAVFLHAAEHIGKPLLGAIRMAVRIEEAGPLEQASSPTTMPHRGHSSGPNPQIKSSAQSPDFAKEHLLSTQILKRIFGPETRLVSVAKRPD